MALPRLSPADQDLVDELCGRMRAAEPRHKMFRTKAERLYALYRSAKEVRRDYVDAVKGQKVDDWFNDYGGWTNLLVPYAFSVVETTLPRIISANPKMNVTPGDPQSEDNVDAMRLMVEREQELTSYFLTLQDVAKTALFYGFGVQKVYWFEDAYDKTILVPKTEAGPNGEVVYCEGSTRHIRYCGPKAECIDPFDFIASPGSTEVANMRWCFHRLWLYDDDIKERFESGRWKLPDGATVEDVLEMADGNKRNEVLGTRDRLGGFSEAEQPTKQDGRAHELLEFWDGRRVVKMLSRGLIVEQGDHPYWHRELPFQIDRPTRVPNELYGIGEIEPIEDLIKEMSYFRSSRLDNAKLVLQRPFAYFEGLVTTKDFTFGPGSMIGVEGDPREVLFPIPMQDIPASSFQEMAEMRSDIERASGIDDTLAGAANSPGGSAETATGVQLIQAAANVRIQNKTRLLEEELVAHAGRQFGALNQQYIVTEQKVVGPPKPDEPDRPWSWYDVGPAQLAGNFAFSVDGGSTSPENDAAKAQRSQAFMMQFGQDPLMDPRKVRSYALSLQGIRNPEAWLKPEEPSVPAQVLDMIQQAVQEDLKKAGIDPAQVGLDAAGFHQLVAGAAQEVQPQQAPPQQGPSG